MSVLALGLNHTTAPLDLRGRLAFTPEQMAPALHALRGRMRSVPEAALVSTCNRTELYASVSRFHGALDDATNALADLAGLPVVDLQARCAVYFDEGAVAHTFAVAAGLDSVVIGESQILGQVKNALTMCQNHGTVGTVLKDRKSVV